MLVVGFGLFMAWAAWAPLDEGVAAPATVSVETHRKVITLNNVNSIALTGVGFTDTLPAQLRIGAGGILSTSCAGTLLDLGGGGRRDGGPAR